MKISTIKIGKRFMAVVLFIIAVFFTGGTDTKESGGSGIYEPPCCDGSWYEPPGTVLPEASLNRPSAGNSVVDPTFGTTITALPGGARNTYSQLQVWSYDNQYMITFSTVSDSYQVRDADSFAVLHQISHSSPRWIPGTHKVISVDNEPGRIFVYDVDTGKEEVLMTLSRYQYITGSTIDIWIDGENAGHPHYNIYRSDIAALFPGYANSNGAAGYFYLDTTAYENGVHTIQWTARDSAGNTDGIGSRYFTIQN